MLRRPRTAFAAFLGLCLATTASEARGDEFYYVMIFGSQSSPKLLQYTHTWASFIRAVGEGPDANNYVLYPRLGLDRYPIEVVPPQQIPKRNCFLCRCPD